MFYRPRRRPRPAAQSLQRHRHAAPDRLDLHARAAGRQPRPLFLLQRHRLYAAAGDVRLDRPQGQPCEYRGDRRLRRQHRRIRRARSDEPHLRLPTRPAPTNSPSPGVERAECETIACPRVADAPATLECRVVEIVQLLGPDNHLILGEVTGIHLRDDCRRGRPLRRDEVPARGARRLPRLFGGDRGLRDAQAGAGVEPCGGNRRAGTNGSVARSGRSARRTMLPLFYS